MNRRTLYFTGPGAVELREEPLPALGSDEVLVQSQLSAISAGTELLVYRGQFAPDMSEPHDKISSAVHYPLAYGYACVGSVVEAGSSVSPDWLNRMVLAFRPHTSRFAARPEELLPIPPDVSAEDAVFLPNMETAANLLQDGAPILGEQVLILGQGIVGLLVTALMRQFPLACIVTADRYELRRQASSRLGVSSSLDPESNDFHARALQACAGAPGFDLILELSGSPSALNDAIALALFSGRILVGSWYGEKQAPIELGGRFHRARLRVISSQVSSISPELGGRWNKARRFGVAWNALRRVHPGAWITHRFSLEQAAAAYQLLDTRPGLALQVVLTYA